MLIGGLNCEVDALLQVTGLESDMEIVSTDILFSNISEETLEAAAIFFIYIYPVTKECPFAEFNSWFSVWSTFYTDLIKTQSADIIILTLNRIIKTTTKGSKDAAMHILRRTASLLSLYYDDIQSRLPKKSYSHMFEHSQILESSDGELSF